MALSKFFRIPWANSGDKTAIPDAVDPSGYVSYTQGYGADYERDLSSDPLAKPVERNSINQALFDITTELRRWQTQAVPDFITTADNGGAPFPYQQYAWVRYDDGGGAKVYESLVDNNTALPTDNTKWDIVSTAQATETVRGTAKIATQTLTDAGTDDTTIITPKKLRFGFSASITTNGYIKLPQWMGGLMIQWGNISVTTSSALKNYPTPFTTTVFWVSAFTASTTASVVATNNSLSQFSAVASANMSGVAFLAIGK